MRSLDFVTAPPSLGVTRALIGPHVAWLVDGLLRLGNGMSSVHQAPVRAPLTIGAGIATVSAISALLWLAGRSVSHRTAEGPVRTRALHATFWASSLVCAAAAYVVTNVALVPSDRYLITAVPAVAATVPLLLTSRRSAWLVAGGATIFMAASTVALLANDEQTTTLPAVKHERRIEAAVTDLHLGVGYAGYWEAGGLMWTSHERLRVYPVSESLGVLQPQPGVARVAAWYRPRRDTPSYLLLVPGDGSNTVDTLPVGFPKPERELRLGPITLATYSYDIATLIHGPPG